MSRCRRNSCGCFRLRLRITRCKHIALNHAAMRAGGNSSGQVNA